MTFNGLEYTQHVARRLVLEFEAAGDAGTPGLIGAAREHPARVQLERMLPAGIGVGSGIVIDSYGSASKQQDIVIYEKNICPTFTYNDTPGSTYFPIEGVIAIGEVKSQLDKSSIDDSFNKIISAKKLVRRAVATNDGLNLGHFVSYRTYGNSICFSAIAENEFNQTKNSIDQIFGFILCGNFKSSANTILEHATNLCKTTPRPHAPNFIASLANGFICPYLHPKNSITRSLMEADGLAICEDTSIAFSQLVAMIRIYVQHGRTVDVKHFERYFMGENVQFPVKTRFL